MRQPQPVLPLHDTHIYKQRHVTYPSAFLNFNAIIRVPSQLYLCGSECTFCRSCRHSNLLVFLLSSLSPVAIPLLFFDFLFGSAPRFSRGGLSQMLREGGRKKATNTCVCGHVWCVLIPGCCLPGTAAAAGGRCSCPAHHTRYPPPPAPLTPESGAAAPHHLGRRTTT